MASRRRSGFAFASLLMLAGLLLLLANFGVLPEGYASELARLWPVVLLAVGANLVLSRYDARLGSAVAVLLVAGALVAAWVVAASGGGLGGAFTVAPIRVEVDGATTARLDLTVAAGKLQLGAGAPPGTLLTGSLETDAAHDALRVEVRDQGQTRRISLSNQRRPGFVFGLGAKQGETWDIRLRSGVPLELRIDGGAARMRLDLRELDVKLLNVDTGATEATVLLPRNAGETRATFSVGAASLDIQVAEGVAARIRVSGGVSSVDVDETRFPRGDDDEYRSPDYDRAENRVDLNVSAGASRVQVR